MTVIEGSDSLKQSTWALQLVSRFLGKSVCIHNADFEDLDMIQLDLFC